MFYIGSLIVGIGGVLWATLKAKDAKLVGSLEARIEAQEKTIADLKASNDATVARLGEKLDKQREESSDALAAQQQARIEDAKKTAKLLFGLQMQQGSRERPREWEEAPTGVRNFLEIWDAGEDARRDPDSIQPPRRPPRPR